jgi:hypothetical protein
MGTVAALPDQWFIGSAFLPSAELRSMNARRQDDRSATGGDQEHLGVAAWLQI